MVTFEAYCTSKKIDFEAFENAEAKEFNYLKNYFNQVSPESFTAQKLFLINVLRRRYLKENSNSVVESETSKESHNITKTVESTFVETQKEKEVEAITEIPKTVVSKPKIPGVKIPARKIDSVVEIKTEENSTEDKKELSSNEVNKNVLKPKIGLAKPKIPAKPLPTNDAVIPEDKPKMGVLRPKIPRKLD